MLSHDQLYIIRIAIMCWNWWLWNIVASTKDEQVMAVFYEEAHSKMERNNIL